MCYSLNSYVPGTTSLLSPSYPWFVPFTLQYSLPPRKTASLRSFKYSMKMTYGEHMRYVSFYLHDTSIKASCRPSLAWFFFIPYISFIFLGPSSLLPSSQTHSLTNSCVCYILLRLLSSPALIFLLFNLNQHFKSFNFTKISLTSKFDTNF